MRKQRVAAAMIAAAILAGILAYNYSVDQTAQRGLQFGTELEQIQDDIGQLQKKFYSDKTRWAEGELAKGDLLALYDKHLSKFEEMVSRYDNLDPPELFESSVALLRLSSVTQLDSDRHFVEWFRTGDESSLVRSDSLFQDAVEFELQGLVEFYSAKLGVVDYGEREQFEAPRDNVEGMVERVYGAMKGRCSDEFGDGPGGFDSLKAQSGWDACVQAAEEWRLEHLPQP